MDQKLAQIYGNNPTDADLEKLAAAELADSLADNGTASPTDGLSEDDLNALASQVLAGEGGEAPAQTDPDQDAQEKVAEADYMGRVMAHAYVQELRSLTKVAEETPAVEAAEKKPGGKMALAKKVGKGVAAAGVVGGAAYLAKKHGGGLVSKGMEMAGKLGRRAGGEKNAAAEEAPQMSPLDTLVNARMHEILEQSGIDPASLTQEAAPQEKTADPGREALAAAVEQRAWEALSQYGVVPQDEEGPKA